MFKLYCLLVFISVFGLNSYGESLNLYGQLSYFLLSISNLLLGFYVSIKKISFKNINYGLILLFTFIYSIFLNGFNGKIITDIIQVVNVLLIAHIFKRKDKDQIIRFVTSICYILFFAGIFSWLFYGLNGIRFQPISYVVIIVFFYKLYFEKFKWTYLIILILSFLIIIDSGRRTNILLSIIGVLFLFYYFKKRFFIIIVLMSCFLFINRDSIQESFQKSEYKTIKRLSIKNSKDQSLDTRFHEVNSVLREFNDENSIIKYIFGFGTGAEYFFINPDRNNPDFYINPNNENIDEYKHHVHFSPVNWYFRHGVLGVVFFFNDCI